MITAGIISRRVLVIVVVACGAPLLLAACGSEPTAADPSREAGNLGTRVCLVNNDTGGDRLSDATGWVTLTGSVAFTTKDTAEEGAFPPGTRLCGEGTFGTGDDVVAYVTWTAVSDCCSDYIWKSSVSATNKWFGSPKVELKSPRIEARFLVAPNDQFISNTCLGQGFKVNESMIGDDGVFQMKVTRLADDQWKEFEVVFTPSWPNEDPNVRPHGLNGGTDCS
jgi:hypothetical protein